MADKPTYEELEQRIKELEGQGSGHLEMDLAALFQGFEDSFPVGITDPKGALLYVNKAFMEMWGYSSPEEIIGRQAAEFWEGPGVYKTMEDLATKGWSKGEDIGKRKDGSLFPVEYKAIMCKNIDGKPQYMLGQFFDISEQKRAEKALRESEEGYRSFLNNLVDGAYKSDDMGNVTYVNETVEKIVGKPLKDIVGKPFYHLFTKDSQAVARDVYSRSLSGESIGIYELEFTNGAVCQFKNALLKDKDGKVVGVFGIMRDISRQKRAEAALRKAHDALGMRVDKRTAELTQTTEQLRALLNATTDTAFLIDLQGNVITSNAVTAERFKISLDKFSDSCVFDLMSPSLAKARKGNTEKVIQTEKPYRFEDKRKGIVFDTTIYPVFDEQAKVVQLAIYGRDITDQRQAEEAIREREKELNNRTQELEETNAALKVLLKRRDEDRIELEEKVVANVTELVEPYVAKLKQGRLDGKQTACVGIIESNLHDIISPLARKLSSKLYALTPRELRVADLVKGEKTTKEIAELMNISIKTVEYHRDNIRKKLGIKNEKLNLRSHLVSLQ